MQDSTLPALQSVRCVYQMSDVVWPRSYLNFSWTTRTRNHYNGLLGERERYALQQILPSTASAATTTGVFRSPSLLISDGRNAENDKDLKFRTDSRRYLQRSFLAPYAGLADI